VATGDRIATLATEELDLAVAQADIAHAQALASVTQGDAALRAAELTLNQALDRITVAEVEAAQADVDGARAYLQYVNNNISLAPPDQQAQWANAQVFAQARLAAAEAKFNAMVTNADTEEVAALRRRVDAAREAAALADRSVDVAAQALEQARNRLADTVLQAPFDGIVARLNAREGDPVTPAVIVAEVIDPSRMQLDVLVDEIDVVDVRRGQKTLIEVDALPGLEIVGEVQSISLLPAVQSGIVVYSTRIAFEAPADSALRVGMSAAADIVITEREDVLLVPDRAVRVDASGRTTVRVPVGETTEERSVTLGISDGVDTEVTGGLQEGESVIVERSSRQTPGLF
jgi:RND family efflux transporter MFP subunit